MTISFTIERPAWVPGAPRVRGWFRAARRKITAVAEAAVAPHETALSNLARMPLTVAALAVADTGSFLQLHGWGYLITAASLLWLEAKIADE